MNGELRIVELLGDFDKIWDDGLTVFDGADEFGFVFDGGCGVFDDEGLDFLNLFWDSSGFFLEFVVAGVEEVAKVLLLVSFLQE